MAYGFGQTKHNGKSSLTLNPNPFIMCHSQEFNDHLFLYFDYARELWDILFHIKKESWIAPQHICDFLGMKFYGFGQTISYIIFGIHVSWLPFGLFG